MAYRYFHPEEEFQVWTVENYADDHPGHCYLVEFADGESYRGVFADAYDSENGCELDIEMDHPLYDEFHQVVFEIIETIQPGLRSYNEWLSVDYRDFPARITDLDTGTVVYPRSR